VTALPVAITRHHTGDDLQWLSPAPLWRAADVGPAASGITQPWIAELRTDSFVDEFLDTLAGVAGRSPADLAGMRPEVTAGSTDPSTPYRLFQPLSRRYYLLTASLACRRPGIPDHRLSPAENDRVFFVMRQIDSAGAEKGFVDGQWIPASSAAVLPGEQEHPMHPASVAAFAEPGTAAANLGMAKGSASSRTVFYGYIPVTSRDSLVPPLADPGTVLKDLQEDMPLPSPSEHPAIVELMGRVIDTWQQLRDSQTTISPPPEVDYPSLFMLLDLLDWLQTHLKTVFDAITQDAAIPENAAAAQALLDAIKGVQIPVTDPGPPSTTTPTDLDEVLDSLKGFLDLVGGADKAGPSTTYDLATATIPATWLEPAKTSTSPARPAGLAGLALAALNEVDDPYKVPPELLGLIKADPVAGSGIGQAGKNQAYVIRAVLSHEPCRPVLSAPTRAFELARALDADAPARPVLLQLPDINNLRKFDRGVAFEMPPSLRQMLDRVTPDLLKDKGLRPDPGLQLGMICSFSLQIIFLVAFIVMFIFLILLNIVFWWLPFLKICFPVPVRPSTPPGPTP